MKIVTIVGARPQFIKAAAVSRPLRVQHQEILVHTGQHYDEEMSDVFFEELSIPTPDYHLNIGSGTHGAMTGRMLEAIENVLTDEKPDMVLVYGDTNSTLAGALAAAKLHIPVAHIEAGLRSFNKAMPEEQNRVLTDHLSHTMFCPTATAVENLKAEGITKRVHLVGDVMVDAVLFYIDLARQRYTNIKNIELVDLFSTKPIAPNVWQLATIHRAENTDDASKIKEILTALEASDTPTIFPVHPRIKQAVQELNTKHSFKNISFVKPVSYLPMLYLVAEAKRVITDSGGLQKECYVLDTPCVTVRDQTEWVETLVGGYNTLAKPEKQSLLTTINNAVIDAQYNKMNFFGDGTAARRIISFLE